MGGLTKANALQWAGEQKYQLMVVNAVRDYCVLKSILNAYMGLILCGLLLTFVFVGPILVQY